MAELERDIVTAKKAFVLLPSMESILVKDVRYFPFAAAIHMSPDEIREKTFEAIEGHGIEPDFTQDVIVYSEGGCSVVCLARRIYENMDDEQFVREEIESNEGVSRMVREELLPLYTRLVGDDSNIMRLFRTLLS